MEPLDTYLQTLNRLFESELIDAKPSILEPGAGEVIFHAGESAQTIFGIRAGKVELVRYLENGQMGHQYALESGAWLGEGALFNTVYQSSAIATQSCQIIAVPKRAFLTLLRHDPEISLTFIGQLTEQLHTAKNLMMLRCIRSAYDRVLAYLHGLTTASSHTCSLDRSLKEIAEQICLTPEVVSRTLRKLQQDGIIQRNQREITFLER